MSFMFFTIKFSQLLVFISYFSLSEIYLKKLKNYNILSLTHALL